MQLSLTGATSLLLGLKKLLCAAGAEWSIFNPPAGWQRREVAQLYGNNDMQTGRPNFPKMVGALLIYPSILSRSASSMCPSHSMLMHPHIMSVLWW